MMVFKEQPSVINVSQSYETELNNIWEGKQDSIFWSKKDEKLDKKNRIRNEKIEKITNSFISQTKGRRHSYGVSESYLWKSNEHREQCFEILQALGLQKQEPEPKQENLYNTDGYYHNIPIPTEKIAAKLYMEKLLPEEIESKYSLGLGGMEVNL
jgi:hypothetical protein